MFDWVKKEGFEEGSKMNLREFYKNWLAFALAFGYVIAMGVIEGAVYIGIFLFIISPALLPILKPSTFSIVCGALLMAYVTIPVGIYLFMRWEEAKDGFL